MTPPHAHLDASRPLTRLEVATILARAHHLLAVAAGEAGSGEDPQVRAALEMARSRDRR